MLGQVQHVTVPDWCWRSPTECLNTEVLPQFEARLRQVVQSQMESGAKTLTQKFAAGERDIYQAFAEQEAALTQSLTRRMVALGALILGAAWWIGRR